MILLCKRDSEQAFNQLCFIELQQTGSYKEQAGFLVAVQYSWYMSEHDTKAAAGKRNTFKRAESSSQLSSGKMDLCVGIPGKANMIRINLQLL